MADKTSDLLIETLQEWGVEVIFGLPGDGINGVMEALRKQQDKICFVHVRHEEAAGLYGLRLRKIHRPNWVFAWRLPARAAFTCSMAWTTPKLDHQPVLAITGMAFHDPIGTHQQQDVELDKLFEDVSVFNQRVMAAEHVQISPTACRTALSYHGVAHITIPADVQDFEVNHRSKRNVPNHNSEVMAHSDLFRTKLTCVGQLISWIMAK